MDINAGMDDVLVFKGKFGFTLQFTDAPTAWTSNVYLVIWPVGDPDSKTSYALTKDDTNWNLTVTKGTFPTAGKFYYCLAQMITDTIEDSTKIGNFEVGDQPVLHSS